MEGVASSSSSTSLVSLISIGSGVGKLSLGIMADIPRVDSVLLYALTVGVSGLGVLIIPYIRLEDVMQPLFFSCCRGRC